MTEPPAVTHTLDSRMFLVTNEQNELSSLLEACGFDIFLGFLHSTRYKRASLSTDMIEDLRSPVIDRLVLYLINKGAIKLSQLTDIEGKKGIRIDDDARKAYLSN